MRKLWYDTSANLCLDNLLLVVAQTGVFIYSAFCIIGAFFQLEDHLLAFLASLATLVQTTLQTVFILDSSSRFACTNEQVKRKPGRQVVTFLLVCNLAMADFCMGLYLGFLAVVDAATLGDFRRFAIDWQFSAGCQVNTIGKSNKKSKIQNSFL